MLEWKDIDGFSKYEVSSIGQIRNKFTGLILTQEVSNCGYGSYTLRADNNEIIKILAHRIVNDVFNGASIDANKDIVNHKDGVKLNNFYKNLEWVTYSANRRHAVDTGLVKSTYRFLLPDGTCVYSIPTLAHVLGLTKYKALGLVSRLNRGCEKEFVNILVDRLSSANGHNYVSIYSLDPTKAELRRHESIGQASVTLGIGVSSLKRALSGSNLINGIFVWRTCQSTGILNFIDTTEENILNSKKAYEKYSFNNRMKFHFKNIKTGAIGKCNSWQALADEVGIKLWQLEYHFKQYPDEQINDHLIVRSIKDNVIFPETYD